VSALLMVGVRNIVLCNGDVNVGSGERYAFHFRDDMGCRLVNFREFRSGLRLYFRVTSM
jgi:hypothetical protein